MSLKKIGASIILEGEKEYRQALKNINQEQKVMTSEMKLTQAQYKNNANSINALKSQYDGLNKQIDKQNEKIAVYEKALSSAKKAEEESAKNVDKYTVELAKARKELDEMEKSADSSNEEIEEQKRLVAELEKQLGLSNTEYQKNATSVNNWQIGLNNAKIALEGMEDDLSKTEKYLEEADKSTDGLAKSIDKYGDEVKDAEGKTLSFGDVLKANLASEVIIKAVERLAGAVVNMAKASIDAGSNFESNMSQVAATMGMTAEEIQNGSEAYKILEDAAKEAGATTMFSASQSAEALNYLALAGYDASKSAETLPKVLDLAAAGGLDLAYASDLVTDSMSALGLETEQLDTFIDEMAKTAQKSNTSVSQLGEAMLVVGGVSSTTGQDLEVINAELGLLANNGIKGAEGGTHLRNILLSLSAPTSDGAKALKELNVEVEDSEGNMRALSDIMVDLNKSLAGMGDVEKANVIKTIFNKTDIAAVNALLKGSNGEFDKLYKELMNCDGAAKNMAKTMQDNLQGKVTILKSALEGLQITAYDLFDDTLKNGVDKATDAVGQLDEALQSDELGVKVGELADAFGDFVENSIDWAVDALPDIIDGLTNILNNADKIIPAIEGIVTGFITFKAASVGVEVITTAMNLYKTATDGATIAQLGLNAAADANPYVLLASVLVGVGTALLNMAKNAKEVKTPMEELVDSYNDEIESQKKSIEKRKEEREDVQNSITATRNLKDELIKLNEKEKLSVEEKARMKQIVQELNSAMPDLNLQLNEETGHLMATNDEIEKQIENRQNLLLIKAAEADQAEIAQSLYDAEKERTKALQEQAEAQEQLNALLEEAAKHSEEWMNGYESSFQFGDKIISNMSDFDRVYDDLTGKVDAYNGVIEEQDGLIQSLNDEYQQVTGIIDGYKGKVNELTGEYDTNTGTVVKWRDQLITVNGDVKTSLEELKGQYDEAKGKAQESLEKQITLFGELSNKSDLTVKQMKDNLDQQTEVINTYADDILKAKSLVEKGMMDEGLLGELEELGLSGAGYLHELVTAAETDEPTFTDAMNAWADQQEALDNLSGVLADMETSYSESFDNIMTTVEEARLTQGTKQEEMIQGWVDFVGSVKDEIVSGSGKWSEESARAVQSMLGNTKTVLGIDASGSSSEGKDIGKSYVDSMADGILENQDNLLDAIDSVTNAANERAKAAVESLNRALGGMI